MEPVKDLGTCYDQMAVVEKYERVIAYLYPIAQSIPRKHGVARDMFLNCLPGIPNALFQAGKSNQVNWANTYNLFKWMEKRYDIAF